MKKRSNGGFTLIELIVIIALIATLAVLLIPSINSFFSTDARKFATKFDALLTQCRVMAMGRGGNVYVMVYKNGNEIHGDYIENGVVVTGEVLSTRNLEVKAKNPSGAEYVLSETQPLYVSFNRATGGLVLFGNTLPADFPTAAMTGQATVTASAGGKTYVVSVTASTGQHAVG